MFQVHNQNREQECYGYDECGYLTQQAQGLTLGLGIKEEERHVKYQDIYQQGHQLNRINHHYYTYDKAGRLTEKTEIREGFRKQTIYYRWNASNQLTDITNNKGEVWYYKYDALGRRISKACPQQRLKLEYIWDGDQLAYTQIFKNGKLDSQRHSVFHGWQLIAQQDRYQQNQQTLDGNKTEWQQQTSYAICQPNGQVLALLNPEGKTVWRKEKQTLWGLLFPNEYRKISPLDPQLLFAGQWLDEESGLAYNCFRYYDPESGNYISSDPIGLNGGETLYSYVHNALDLLDPFGLASCRRKYMGNTPSKKSRTGREVIERMRAEGKIIGHGKTMRFQAGDGQWYNIGQADMAHKTDAVSWWNTTGRHHGARSPEVRNWMLNSDNYYLEHFSINRSQGAILREIYLPPLN